MDKHQKRVAKKRAKRKGKYKKQTSAPKASDSWSKMEEALRPKAWPNMFSHKHGY